MGRSNTSFVAARPLPTGRLWFALVAAWLAGVASALLLPPLAAAALTTAGLVLVATLGFGPIRSAFAGERRKITALLNAVPEGILEIDAAGSIVFVNPQLCDLFGYLPEELLGQPVERLVPPAARGAHGARRAAFWSSSRSRPMGSGLDICGVRKDGSLVPVDVSLSRLETRHGTVMYCLVRDNSARKAFEKQLLDSNRRLTDSVTTLESYSHELQTLTDMGELLHSSNTETELYGIVARTMERLFPGLSGALYMLAGSRTTAAMACAWGEHAVGLGKPVECGECWALRRGRAHHYAAPADHPRCGHHADNAERCGCCIPLLGHGELLGVLHLCAEPEPAGMLAVPSRLQLLQALANQIALSSANLRLRETLRAQSVIDPLTGLHNRRILEQRFDDAFQRAAVERRDIAVLVLDIDHFKSFNDRHGHECGDIALREVGALLRRLLRHDDIVCRMGGEEFAILLPDTSRAEAEGVAEKLRLAVEALPLQRDGRLLGRISVSVGVAVPGAHCESAAMLMRHADRALYRAKGSGRNRVVTSGPGDETGVQRMIAHMPRQA